MEWDIRYKDYCVSLKHIALKTERFSKWRNRHRWMDKQNMSVLFQSCWWLWRKSSNGVITTITFHAPYNRMRNWLEDIFMLLQHSVHKYDLISFFWHILCTVWKKETLHYIVFSAVIAHLYCVLTSCWTWHNLVLKLGAVLIGTGILQMTFMSS